MTATQQTHQIVSREQWLTARKALLAREKEFTRQRDELSRLRRELPWERVEKDYLFDGPAGTQTLADLFAGRSQLIVYHFMLGPGWTEGCKSCSFLADHIDGSLIHLAHRDVTLTVASRAPYPEIAAFQQRMGWLFPWVSCHNNDFNFDYQASSTSDQRVDGKVYYNYEMSAFPGEERPALSVFCKQNGEIFHTYSTYARGLDILLGTYNYLDLTPRGRDEHGLSFTMSWLRHHDRYEASSAPVGIRP